MRLFLKALAFLFLAHIACAEEQIWTAKGTLQLEAGKYRLSFREKTFWRICGFAYEGKELFIENPGASSSGTRYEIFPKDHTEKLNSVKLTIDGALPPKVEGLMKGNRLVLEREARYGTITLFSRYELNAEDGLVWTFKYRVEDTSSKPKYFWMFTMAWDNSFSKYIYMDKNCARQGDLVSDHSWRINDNINALAMYSPKLQALVLTKVLTPIPTEVRKHTIWDTKSYHKYFVQHKLPKWEVGYTSPEYATSYTAYTVPEEQWLEKAEQLLR
ncbi:MAG: hypothetical protein J5746_09735 [Victivallales bacterium]|nr:hypothetical protein [Victivallales bacterium]